MRGLVGGRSSATPMVLQVPKASSQTIKKKRSSYAGSSVLSYSFSRGIGLLNE